MGGLGLVVENLLYLLTAGCGLALVGWLFARKAPRGPAIRAEASALLMTACWALSAFALGREAGLAAAASSLAQLCWLWMLYRLFAHDQRDTVRGPIRPVVVSLAFVEAMQLVSLALAQGLTLTPASAAALFNLQAILRLLFSTGALVLLHNVYAGASQQARRVLGPPATALAVLWFYDLNLATVSYLTQWVPDVLDGLRSAVALLMIGILAIGVLRNEGDLRFQPSRSFAFRSASLILIAAYLAVMALAAQGLAYAGGELGRLLQAGFLVLAVTLALLWLPSRRLRNWLRLAVTQHLFQHRYDYRAEWLRFTETLGRGGSSAEPLEQRVVRALADITDSTGGLLLTPADDGALALSGRWQWPDIEVPSEAIPVADALFFERSQFVIDLDNQRRPNAAADANAYVPQWLVQDPSAWVMIPLLHYERLVGVVALNRPILSRRLDWEDFDLLKVVGRQLASYLAEQGSRDALGEVQSFDEFNRRIAFVMHDIKNLASQLSLLSRNAVKHADNPEFRSDMLLTLRNSTDKLQTLLDRLGRYGPQGGSVQAVDPSEVLTKVRHRYGGRHKVVVIERDPIQTMADAEALEQALLHLVQNAIDATPSEAPVLLDLREEGTDAVIEVLDSGEGMSPEFIRSRLFKPFHSSKPGGFGIGAFEARELVRGMGGRLEVESRVGLGTRFRIRLPLAPKTDTLSRLQTPEVA